MSIKAYRIVEIKLEPDYSSFNLSQHDDLIAFLDAEAGFYSQLADDGTGIGCVPIRILERAIKRAKNLSLSEETIRHLRRDIRAAKAQGEDCIEYQCF